MSVKEAFAATLRQSRLSAGLSQERLARASGLDRTTLSLLERGKQQPTLSTILLLAEHLGVSGAHLVQEVEDFLHKYGKTK
jgi:transcriptional regulator with XRE-family HTH domain